MDENCDSSFLDGWRYVHDVSREDESREPARSALLKAQTDTGTWCAVWQVLGELLALDFDFGVAQRDGFDY